MERARSLAGVRSGEEAGARGGEWGRQRLKSRDTEQMQRGWYNAKILAGEANINTVMLAGKVNMIAKILARLANVNSAEI